MSRSMVWAMAMCGVAGLAVLVSGSVARDAVVGVVMSLDGNAPGWSTRTYGSGASSPRGRHVLLSTQDCDQDCRVARWHALPPSRDDMFRLEVAVTPGTIPEDGFARGLLAGADSGSRLWWGTRRTAPNLWVGRVHQSLDGRTARVGVVVRGTDAAIEVERVRLLAVRPSPVWRWSVGSVLLLALGLVVWGLRGLADAAGNRSAVLVLGLGLGSAVALGLPFGTWIASAMAPDPWLAPVRLRPLMGLAHVGMFAAFAAVGRRSLPGNLADHVAVWVSLAVTSEALQGLSSSRSAEWEDILADLIGVALGLALRPGAARRPSLPRG